MTEIRISDHVEQRTAAVREQVAMDQLPEFFHRAFDAAMALAKAQGVQVTGPPFGKYYGIPSQIVDVEAGFPVAGPVTEADGVIAGTLPGGRVVQATHVGPYDTLPQTYGEVERWIDERGLRAQSVMWESYLTDPGEQPDPSSWQTLIVVPLAQGGETD